MRQCWQWSLQLGQASMGKAMSPSIAMASAAQLLRTKTVTWELRCALAQKHCSVEFPVAFPTALFSAAVQIWHNQHKVRLSGPPALAIMPYRHCQSLCAVSFSRQCSNNLEQWLTVTPPTPQCFSLEFETNEVWRDILTEQWPPWKAHQRVQSADALTAQPLCGQMRTDQRCIRHHQLGEKNL